jgi:hypothetical protein
VPLTKIPYLMAFLAFKNKKVKKKLIGMAAFQAQLMSHHISVQNSKPKLQGWEGGGGSLAWKYGGLHSAVRPCKHYHKRDFLFY